MSPKRSKTMKSKCNRKILKLERRWKLRLIKTKLDEKFAQFLNMFKKLEINIPFADALAQMPNYVKFMKKIMSNKKNLEAYGTMNLSKNYSAINQ